MKHALLGIRLWRYLGMLGAITFWTSGCGTELRSDYVSKLNSVPHNAVFSHDPVLSHKRITEELDKTVDQLDRMEFQLNKKGEKVYDARLLSVFSEIQAYATESRGVDAEAKAVFSVSGGWNSCSMSQFFATTAAFLRAELRRGIKYKFVASCYGKTSDTVYFITSENTGDLTASTPATLAKIISAKSVVVPGKHVYMIGHSYGGWLAMNLAWYMPESAVLKGLVTLDPISKINCTPYDLVGSYLRSQFSLNAHQGCVEAPTDFTAKELAYIKNRSPFWQNFYEDTSIYLHSSRILDAKNFYLYYEVNSVLEIFDPHRSIDTDERSWNSFGPLITAG